MKGLLRHFFKPSADKLIEALFTSDTERQAVAIEMVTQSTDEEIPAKLREALKHPSDIMRGAAARALASRQQPGAFLDLVWLLPVDGNDVDAATEDVVGALTALAGTAGDRERRQAVEGLQRLLGERMPASLYFTVPHALAALGDRAGFDHLIGLIKSTRPTAARIEAAEAIANIAVEADQDALEAAADSVRREIEFAHLHGANPEWFQPLLMRLERILGELQA